MLAPQEEAPPTLAAVIPAFQAARRLAAVLAAIPPSVQHVIVVDDASTDDTARAALTAAAHDPRIKVLRHRRNLGVGGAMLTGYAMALRLGADVVVKLDADGQMDPAHIGRLVAPLVRGEADYAKGNRFLVSLPRSMPLFRLFGNLGLTFITKLATGYWHLFDPTNGYTAMRAAVLAHVDPSRVSSGYFFEISLLLELRRLSAVVHDVPIPAKYDGAPSSMSLPRVLVSFPPLLLLGFLRRLGRQYYLYDFNAASVMVLLGVPLLLGGAAWGAGQWYVHSLAGQLASTGTVLLGVLPIILGVQLLLQALVLDIQAVPRRPVHPRLFDRGDADALPALLDGEGGAGRLQEPAPPLPRSGDG